MTECTRHGRNYLESQEPGALLILRWSYNFAVRGGELVMQMLLLIHLYIGFDLHYPPQHSLDMQAMLSCSQPILLP